MSLSGSSASRKSIWAMTRLAISSSMYVGRKMIRSLSSLEKMSKARSPRGVCSTTIGTRAMGVLTVARAPGLLPDGRIPDQEVEGQSLAQALAQRFEVPTFLHHTPDREGRTLHRLGQTPDL